MSALSLAGYAFVGQCYTGEFARSGVILAPTELPPLGCASEHTGPFFVRIME